METSQSVACLFGVGESKAALLQRLSLKTVGDLLLHLPVRFLDRRYVTPVANLRPGADFVVSGTVTSVKRRRAGRGPYLSALLSDQTGSVTLTFFRSGYPAKRIREGISLIAAGRVESFRGYTIVHPELYFGRDEAGAADAPGMLPLYRLTAGLTQRTMRKIVASALEAVKDSLVDILPPDVVRRAGFSSRWDLFRAAHMPKSPEEGTAARDTIALEELYLYRSVLKAMRAKEAELITTPVSSITLEEFESRLPWPLTPAQRRVCRQIELDMSGDSPMRRLLQGDVGSGKTVVAAFACAAAVLSGKTAAVLAPTEVLAAQHYEGMSRFLGGFGIRVYLLTGGTPKAERGRIAEEMAEAPDALVVGTHAVLEDWVPLNSLALLVVDEQHRFGVAQRGKLLAERTPRPHALVMSATPIPRTLAMTFYGDLDLSVLDDMPPGRGSVETTIVGPSTKSSVFRFAIKRLEAGERVFLVYPLKEVSEKSDLTDAATAYELVRKGPMAPFGTGLLHGSMKPEEKLEVTEKFRRGDISVLVSTTVIEVGIDVPEATVMVIVNAERFGLSQLHQLRGRVGRGGRNSWCFLVPGANASRESLERLRILVSTSDGFAIAEKDLALRGPGQILGTAQHGIPAFRVADLSVDEHLVKQLTTIQPLSLASLHKILSSQMWRYGGIEFPAV